MALSSGAYSGDVPRVEGLVEFARPVDMGERVGQGGDATDVPPVDVLIKRGVARRVVHEHRQVRQQANVPLSD